MYLKIVTSLLCPFFPTLNKTSSFNIPSQVMFSKCLSFFVLAPRLSIFVLVLQVRTHHCQVEGNKCVLYFSSNVFINASQNDAAFFTIASHCWLILFVIHCNFQIFPDNYFQFCIYKFDFSFLSIVVRSLLNLILDCFSYELPAVPPRLMQIKKILNALFTSSFNPLMKVLNRIVSNSQQSPE